MSVERGVAVFFFIVSVAYLFLAMKLSFGAPSAPKAGFLPQIVGVMAVALSGVDLVRTLRKPVDPVEGQGASLPDAVLLAVATMGVYILILPRLGFFISTTAATLALLKIAGTRGAVLPVVLSVAMAGAIWIGFVEFLQLPLPRSHLDVF